MAPCDARERIRELEARVSELELELSMQKVLSVAAEQEYKQDAIRYRRLRLLGAAPSNSRNLEDGTVLCFTNLDEHVDTDLSHYSRGESLAAADGNGEETVTKTCGCYTKYRGWTRVCVGAGCCAEHCLEPGDAADGQCE